MKGNPHERKKFLPKLAEKDLISVIYNGLRKTMQFKMCSKYNRATMAAEKGWDRARKCAYLLSLSTTTNTVSFPLDFSRPSRKSIKMSSQMALDIGKGCSNPAGAVRLGLFL